MNLELWMSFVGTVLIIGITPGPSVLLATANSIDHGSKKTVGTILGDLSANALQIVLSSAGLAALVASSGDIFSLVKWIGVGYLIYMGLMKIISKPEVGKLKTGSSEKSFFKLYAEGFFMSASNPKPILFFAAFFPLFIDQGSSFISQVIILGITYLTIDGICLLLYVQFATALKTYLEDKGQVYLQNRIVGSLLIFSGVVLSTVKRANN